MGKDQLSLRGGGEYTGWARVIILGINRIKELRIGEGDVRN